MISQTSGQKPCCDLDDKEIVAVEMIVSTSNSWARGDWEQHLSYAELKALPLTWLQRYKIDLTDIARNPRRNTECGELQRVFLYYLK